MKLEKQVDEKMKRKEAFYAGILSAQEALEVAETEEFRLRILGNILLPLAGRASGETKEALRTYIQKQEKHYLHALDEYGLTRKTVRENFFSYVDRYLKVEEKPTRKTYQHR